MENTSVDSHSASTNIHIKQQPHDEPATAEMMQLQQLFLQMVAPGVKADQATVDKIDKLYSGLTSEQKLSLQANLMANPQMKPVVEPLIDALLFKVAGGDPALMSEFKANAHFGNLVGVTMLEVMMELMKAQQARAKIDSEKWVDMKDQIIDLAEIIGKRIETKAQYEALGLIINSVCSAAAVVGQGAALGGAFKAAKTPGGNAQLYTTGAQMVNTFFTGFLQNAANAPLKILEGKEESARVEEEAYKTIAEGILQKYSDDGSSAEQSYDSFNQALQQWLTKYQELVKGIR